MSETKPKKMVRRSVAIALGIICIILAVSLDARFGYYTMLLNNKSKEYDDYARNHSVFNSEYERVLLQSENLQTWLDGNKTLLNQTQVNNTNLQNQIDSLNSNVTNLQNQVNNFHVGSTENSTIWANSENMSVGTSGNASVQTSGNVSVVGIDVVGLSGYVPSAGYVSIRVSSNNNSTYVALSHLLNNYTNAYLFEFDYSISVGFGGTVVFPVLPTSTIQIDFGTSFGEATLTVTITYYY